MGPVDLQNRIQDDKYDFQRRNIVKQWRNNNRGFIHYKNLTLRDHNFIITKERDCFIINYIRDKSTVHTTNVNLFW